MIISGQLTNYFCDHRDCVSHSATPRVTVTEGREYRRIPDGWAIVRSAQGTADLCSRHRAAVKAGCVRVDDVLWTRTH